MHRPWLRPALNIFVVLAAGIMLASADSTLGRIAAVVVIAAGAWQLALTVRERSTGRIYRPPHNLNSGDLGTARVSSRRPRWIPPGGSVGSIAVSMVTFTLLGVVQASELKFAPGILHVILLTLCCVFLLYGLAALLALRRHPEWVRR